MACHHTYPYGKVNQRDTGTSPAELLCRPSMAFAVTSCRYRNSFCNFLRTNQPAKRRPIGPRGNSYSTRSSSTHAPGPSGVMRWGVPSDETDPESGHREIGAPPHNHSARIPNGPETGRFAHATRRDRRPGRQVRAATRPTVPMAESGAPAHRAPRANEKLPPPARRFWTA